MDLKSKLEGKLMSWKVEDINHKHDRKTNVK